MNMIPTTIRLTGQVVFLVFAVNGPLALAQESGGQPLRWKFAEGDQLNISLKQETSTTTLVDRRETKQSNQMDLTIGWTVESVDDKGTATIRQEITAIRAVVTLPDAKGPQTTIYDSAEENQRGSARQLAKSFSRILNQPVTITMTARGEITDVEIPKETLESMRQMPGSMEGREVFSVESVREMFQSAGTEFPRLPWHRAQSWKVRRKFSIGSPHQFTRETTYTLGDQGKIDFNSTISVDSNVGQNENPDVQFFTWSIPEQQSDGQLSFDAEAGRVTNSRSTLLMKTETAYQSFAVSTTVESQIEMTVTSQ